MAIVLPVGAVAAIIWFVAAERGGGPGGDIFVRPVVLQPVTPEDVRGLEALFADRGFQWPPEGTVPRIAVQRLPAGLAEAPIPEKKALFFRALLPLVLAENRQIERQRRVLQEAFAGGPAAVGRAGWGRAEAIAGRYGVDGDLRDPAVQRRLLLRVDRVPVALALAQAANESAWGASRFTREANSLFGQWTYREGAGVVPRRRREGAEHMVRAFPGLRASVRAYLHNLNTGHAYTAFRGMRARLRAAGQPLDPLVLAGGLVRYSERGWGYVKELRSMIRGNRLNRLPDLRLAG